MYTYIYTESDETDTRILSYRHFRMSSPPQDRRRVPTSSQIHVLNQWVLSTSQAALLVVNLLSMQYCFRRGVELVLPAVRLTTVKGPMEQDVIRAGYEAMGTAVPEVAAK
jgi:hypothetical protein